jgi:alkylation response protein AidB-like acyl-CoA dehydrogenase
MSTARAASVDDYLAIVKQVAPVAARCADWSEAHARPADEFVEALRESGLLRMLTPVALGGAGLSPWVIGPVFEAMARIDGSAGWTLALAQGVLAHLLSPQRYQELFGDRHATMAGSLNPVGVRAEIVDGGYHFTGKGTYVSGCTHASWMMAGAMVTEGGRPKIVDGAPLIRAGVMPMSACRILDTWHTSGMRGTGSHDVEFEQVFVPDDLVFAQGDALANLGASLAPVGLGIARHAVDAFIELAQAKVPTGARSTLKERSSAQSQLGRALGLLQAARSFFYETAREADALRDREQQPTVEERARFRLGSVMAAQLSADAIDLIYDAAGLTAATQSCPIERCWRDIHTLRQHITLATTRYEVVGRVCLGLDPQSPLI